MRKFCAILAAVIVVVPSSFAIAGKFKVYPGATLDERATNDSNELAKQTNMPSKTEVYTTHDDFDKVASFYKGIGREYQMPGVTTKSPQMIFIIFDDAKDFASSRLWAKVQRPAMGLYKEDLQEMKSRDITVIVLVEK